MKAPTLCSAFQASTTRVPERAALSLAGSEAISWAEYAEAVREAAAALASLGIGRGDRVAFLSRNRPELAIAEVAVLSLGAAGVVLFTASPAATIEHVLADSEPTALLVETALEPRLAELRLAPMKVLGLDAGETSLDRLSSVELAADFDLDAASAAVASEDLAALIYTSGTTGPAKGVEWTHGAAVASLAAFDAALGEPDGIHDISFAPFASLAERYGGHWHSLIRGSTRTICMEPTQLLAALLEARPTRLGGPPQVWQLLARGLEATVDPEERAILDAATRRYSALVDGETPELATASEEATLASLRGRIGLDRIVQSGSTAAACPLTVHTFFGGLGVPFREFYAMTEAGVVAAQRPGPSDFGTLGTATPGYELRTAEDGEVLVRGPAPSRYRNRPRESAETYGADGWIRTGDIGEIDAEGRLRLVDRKKEMIVPSHGHNVSPAQIETAIKAACPLVSQACVVGDARPHLAALLVVNLPEDADREAAETAVAAALAAVNSGLDARERVEAYAIVADVWLPGAELTETLKLRRAHIAERYAEAIEALYTTDSG